MSEPGTGARPFRWTEFQIKRNFKHAADFGVDGPYNRVNSALYARALVAHVTNPDSRSVVIRYGRGAGSGGFPAVCYVRKGTSLAVIATMDGAFVTGYELSPDQMDNVLRRGKLGGG